MFSRRIIDETLAVKRQQDFSAGHIFQAAIRLNPVPFLAKDFGDLSTAFVPVIINGSLNVFEIDWRDGSFSDGDG